MLIGLPIGSSELVLSPKLHDIFFGGGSGSGGGVVQVFSVGIGVGLAFHLGPTFQVMPEVTVLRPLNAGAASTGGNSDLVSVIDSGASLMQIGVGVLFGGR